MTKIDLSSGIDSIWLGDTKFQSWGDANDAALARSSFKMNPPSKLCWQMFVTKSPTKKWAKISFLLLQSLNNFCLKGSFYVYVWCMVVSLYSVCGLRFSMYEVLPQLGQLLPWFRMHIFIMFGRFIFLGKMAWIGNYGECAFVTW